MNATRELIAALVAGGMDAADAAGLVARAAVEMTGALTRKSSGAIRQQRYRERNKASPTVTENNEISASPTVTNRNETVTSDTASLSKEERKKEVKKREGAKQLPADWLPISDDWIAACELLGIDLAKSELAKFKDHALDKGRVAKNWGAAWRNWTRRAVEYGANRNGYGTSNLRTDPAAGRATTREAQHVATMGAGALRFLEEGKSARAGRETPDGVGTADVFDFGKRTENAR